VKKEKCDERENFYWKNLDKEGEEEIASWWQEK
jgi:hypothetical protein